MAEEETKVAAKKTTSTAAKSTTTKKSTTTSTKAKATTAKAAAPKAEKPAAEPKSAEKKVEAPKAPAAKPAAKVEAKPVEKKVEVKAEAKVEAPKAEKPAKAKKGCPKATQTNRLKDKFDNVVKPHMMEKYHYSSVMQIPHLEKIVINVGCGDATENSKVLDDCLRDLTIIAGQHPVSTKAKKSIATFKVREGQGIGCKVTLRGIRMYEFLDKLVSVSLPRVRDFRGVSKNAFDGHGNYTLGIKEQLIFPEIDYDKVSKIRGMDIVIVTTAKNDDEAFTLLDELGMPFHK